MREKERQRHTEIERWVGETKRGDSDRDRDTERRDKEIDGETGRDQEIYRQPETQRQGDRDRETETER